MKNMNGVKIAEEINETLGHNTVTARTCQNWISQFNQGNFELTDSFREGRPLKIMI